MFMYELHRVSYTNAHLLVLNFRIILQHHNSLQYYTHQYYTSQYYAQLKVTPASLLYLTRIILQHYQFNSLSR